MARGRYWRTTEVKAVQAQYPRLGRLFTLPGRSPQAIRAVAHKNGIKTHRWNAWTEQEIKYLSKHWGTRSSGWLEIQLGRSPRAICNKAVRLGLQKIIRTRLKNKKC